MGLPTTRDQTFTPLSPVPSAVLNNIQDAIVAQNTLLHVTPQTRVFPCNLGFQSPAGTDWAKDTDKSVAVISAPADFIVPLVMESGWRITVQIRWKHSVATASALGAGLYRSNGDAAHTLVGTINSLALATLQTQTLVTAHDVISGEKYTVDITVPTVGVMTRSLYEILVIWTRP